MLQPLSRTEAHGFVGFYAHGASRAGVASVASRALHHAQFAKAGQRGCAGGAQFVGEKAHQLVQTFPGQGFGYLGFFGHGKDQFRLFHTASLFIELHNSTQRRFRFPYSASLSLGVPLSPGSVKTGHTKDNVVFPLSSRWRGVYPRLLTTRIERYTVCKPYRVEIGFTAKVYNCQVKILLMGLFLYSLA
jgi:hypothetical protein